VGCYPGQIVADNSSVRDKTALRDRTLSDETKAKISASAGWNRGLTKETDERVAHAAEAMKGRAAWNTGLTKADHPSLQSASEKLSAIKTGVPNDGARLDLSLVDFTPYLDETGAVDLWTMAEELELSDVTLRKYMRVIGLRSSAKNMKANAERRVVRLLKCDLERFTLGNGKVAIGDAMVGLHHSFGVIKRECDRHGLKTYSHRVRQTICLDAVSKALGVVGYQQEWRSRQFMTEKGNPFRFDGFFPTHRLVVEFHGYQHYTFPSVYIKDKEVFLEKQERDRLKKAHIEDDPVLRYFEVREDEPYSDPAYLRARLMEEGIFDPGK
jgi:hypothetical protein